MFSDFSILFPGQGAQTPGMAADLVEACPPARELFERGRECLGFDLLAICRNGPGEVLNSTRVSQPAIFLHSMAALEALRARLGESDSGALRFPARATAGLSLGEYSALVFAGCLEFEDALRLVIRRGETMQEACDRERGTMVSVLGLEAARIEEIVGELRDRRFEVGIANYNSPGQIVISGREEAVAEAVARLREAGARRLVPLRVAGAYHSPLMAGATRKMRPLLEEVTIRPPRIPFYANYGGARVWEPEEIRRGLILQIENAVRWQQSMADLAAGGARQALEVGPGKVIQGLLRRISRDVEVLPAGTVEAIGALGVMTT